MEMVTAKHIFDKFSEHITHLHGPLEVEVNAPKNYNTNEKNIIAYINSEKVTAEVTAKDNNTFVVSGRLADWATENLSNSTVFTSENTMLAMALINDEFFPVLEQKLPFEDDAIHPTAVIHPTAQLGENVVVGPNAVIGSAALIGNNCIVGANTTIETKAKIGDGSHIHANAFIGHSCVLGAECEIHPNASVGSDGFGFAHTKDRKYIRMPHYGKVVFGDRVCLGNNSCVDRGTYEDTVIGEGTIIDNDCHIGHNNVYGKNCILTASYISAGSTYVGDNFVAGGRSSAGGHINVCDNVQIAANTTMTKDIEKPGHYAGYPIVEHKQAIRYLATLPSLPEMKKTLAQLKKKILD